MAALIISGEVIFALPFHISRFFRPSLLRVFDLSHAELGAMQSVYGVVARLAYFPGGALADLFSGRKRQINPLECPSVTFSTFP